MLIGEKTKYLGLIFGIAFATLLMSQQVTLFFGILNRTGNIIRDMREADIWVMDPKVEYVDEAVALPDRDLSRVKGVEGIEWAVPFYKSMGVVKTRTGHLKQVMILGVDDTALIGRPHKMLSGKWEDLRQPTSIIMDKAGWEFLFPKTPFQLGTEMEFNDTRVIVVGICEALPLFATMPIFFTRYSEAVKLVPQARNRMSFILAKANDDQNAEKVAEEIQNKTGLQALTSENFIARSVNYYLKNTAIPINFGLTVTLGFIIGAVVAGQTFYIFIIENLQQFGALKAIGCSNKQILKMVILQALVVAIIGYCIGIGVTSSFFLSVSHLNAFRNIMLPWFVALGTFVAVLLIMLFASIFSIRKVFVLDTAIVFRG
jgi:putative ABC transport system permease protein